MSQALSANSIITHYRIVSKLGAGGMGEVWLAEDTRLGRKVALKLLPAEFTEDSERVRRFTLEAKAASALNHPNIISVYDIGECETGRFIVMEFVDGRTLRSVIAKDNSLETFFALGAQMVKALSTAHAAGITHRDIKPDNIMVRDDGYVKMLDFGLARLLPTTSSDPEAMTLAQQTTPGTVMGTLAYMSPEQASGQTVGSASDVFALGIVLYELATGSHPFKSETMIGYLHAITSQTPPSMTSLKSHLPPALDDLILRMLEKDVDSRPTAKEVVQALNEIEKYGSGNTLPIRIVGDKPKVTSAEEGFWVAVLPFKYRGSNADLEALAEGLSEDIITGLSRFSCLRVIARGSTLRFTSENADVRSIGKQLGARYVMEGSLRQAGSILRLVTQLVDASTGAHLWAETYDRTVDGEKIFALQDELVPRIVSTVADWYGVLTHSMSEAVRLKPLDQLTPYEAVLRSFGYYERVTPEEHAASRSALERAVEQAPGNADGWAMLSMMYGEEFRFGFNEQPDAMGRSLQAARRAVDAAPSNHFAHLALAQALFFRKEFDRFRHAAERAIALNSMDGSTMEYLSHLIAFSGDWDYGCKVAERARQLNPNHPGWYWAVPFYNAYRNGDYPSARAFALKIDQPTVDLCQVMLAAVYGQLGEHEAADRTVQALLSLTPDTTVTRAQLDKWYQPELVEKLIDGLRKAGLNIDEQAAPSLSGPASTETRSSEGFWVAVLPFKFTGSNAEVATLADGLTEEIVTGLSRFSYLRVISRSSTLQFATESSDIRTIGRTLGARYVMEGSLRLAGSLLRLSVQLVDATTGAHLWAKTYDRPFRSEEIFSVQDDLVPRIVSTVADAYGVLPRSMSQAVRSKEPNELTPYEALLRSFSYVERVSIEEHGAAKAALERAVEQAPGDANCWAMLSILLTDEYIHGFNPQPDSLERAQQAARRAVDADTSNHRSYQALAWALYFRKEFQASRTAAEQAISLNPMDASNSAYMGQTIAFGGDWERGCTLITGAMQLNPSHPGWYWYAPFLNAYRKGEYSDALSLALKINMPGLSLGFVALAAAYGQLGETTAGRDAVRELVALRPDFAVTARAELKKTWDAELVEHLIEGLHKAGLEISDEEHASTSPTPSGTSSVTRADEGFWVAVLPFKFTGSNTEVATLAEGLSEEIVTGLSRFSYLRVIARNSSFDTGVNSSAVKTSARYAMEGSLRQSGTKLRLAVQLVDTTTGAHLWAENYEREFSPETVFELQDDLVPRIVSTVADQYGALVHSMSESLRGRKTGDYSPHEAMLRAFGYWERMTPEEHAEVRDILEAAVTVAPDHSDCLAELAMVYWHEYAFGYNLRPDPIGRARAAAQRAVAAAPTSHFAHCALATSLFFKKDYLAFLPAAERALALNRMDSSTAAILGNMIAYSGDWEYGLEIVERAMQLNPHHGGWYHYVAFCDAYRKHDYHGALASALKVNMPAYHWPHVYLAAVYGQLGEQQRASAALRELHALLPSFGATAREEFGKWLDPELTEHLLDGLRKAGLEIAEEERSADVSAAHHLSGEKRADEGFWVAVLPFKATGTNAELSTLAEGLSDEIVTGLNRFSYLRVIARSSTLRYASQTSDVRTVGKTLGARYVMEGNVRQAGSVIRVTVQLADAGTGAQLWAETYDRPFKPEEIFALQDDLVPRIVSTVADQHGVLPHSMSEVVRAQDPDQLTAYETLLRGFRYYEGVSASEHATIRASLERALKTTPGSANCWAMLSIMYCDEHKFGFNQLPDSLGRALNAAQRAVEISPTNPFAYEALSQALFFRKEFDSFRNAAERAIALNPMDGATNAFMGILIAFTGDWDYGCAVAERATQLNPHHPGWYWNAAFYNAYRKRDYKAALKITLEFNMPGLFYHHVNRAAVYGQLGEHEAARKALEELLALKPDFANTGRVELGKWLQPEFVEHVIEGLRNAGLGIPDDKSSISRFSPQTSRTNSLETLLKSIAVLPFKNLSVDPEQEFFADGITEEILNALAQIKDLRVAGRSSSFSFKGRNEDLRSVGAKLNVTSILEGTLRRSGDRLRITAQLIDTVNGYQLWSERYDRVLDDIFNVQDEIALAVVDALKLKLFGDAKEAVVKRYTDDAEVHELFLKGRYYSYKYTAAGWTRAVEFFEKVLEKQPCHAPAHAGKAAALGCLWFFGLSPADETIPSFRSAATKAIELDGNLSGAHLSLALVNFFHDWEWEKAEQEFKQAILLNPKDAEALSYYAIFLGFVPRFDEAMALARRALEVDPLSLLINMNVGWTYFSAGLTSEAFDQARKMTEIEPDFFGAYWLKGATCLENGDYEEAIDQLTKAVSLGAHPIVLADLGAAYALAGKKETAETILDQLLDMRRQSYVPAICLVRVYSRLGEPEKTIQWLKTAFEERNGELVFLESEITSAAKGDSLNSLGRDPRVKVLLERMKLPSKEPSSDQENK